MSVETTRSSFRTRVLRPPQFDDPELTRSAIILHRLLFSAFGILVPLLVITPMVNRDPLAPWAVYGALLVACGTALWLMRCGRVRVASIGVVCAVWLIALGDIATAGGIRGPGTVLFIVAVLVAGLMLGTRAAIITAIASVLAGLGVAVGETSALLAPDPVTVWRTWAGVSGGIVAVVVFLHFARQSEKERQEVGERLGRVLDETAEGFVLLAVDGQIIDANPAATKILGYSRDELCTLSADQLDAGMTRQEVHERLQSVVGHGSARFETKGRRGDGEIIDLELYATAMRSGPGEVAAVFLRDVTERKRAEQALRKSEMQYRGLFDHSRDAIFVTTMDGEFIDANPSMLNLFGYGREDLTNLNAQALYHDPEDRLRFQELIARFGSMKDFSVKLRKENGSLIDCLLTANARRDQSGTILGYEGVIRDVTEQRRTERALRESEHRLAAAERLAMLGSWEWDMREGTVGWSDELYRVLGERRAESTPSYDSFRQRVHPDDAESVDRLVQEAIERGDPFECFHRIVRPDGAERILHSRGEVIHDEDGQPVRMVGSAQDVTDLRRAEQALRESEERYRVLFESAPIGIGVADTNGALLTFNKAILEPGGYDGTMQEMSNVADFYVDPGDRTKMLEAFREQGTVRQAETRFKRKDGGWYHAALSLNPVTIDGRDALLAIVQDISERRRAEEELAKAQALLLAAIEQTPAGILIADVPDGHIRIANSAALGIRGVADTPLTDIPIERHPESWQVFHPDGRPFEPEELPLSRAVLFGETVRNVEALIRHQDGSERWVLANAAPVLGPDGDVAAGVVVFPEITDRKRTELALAQSEARYRAIVEDQTEFVVRWLPNGTRTFVNQAYCDFLGGELDGLVGTSFFPVLPEEDREKIEKRIQRLTVERPSVAGENRARAFDGTMRWLQWTDRGVFDDNGRLVELQSVGRDITARRRAEEALRASESRFSKAFGLSPDAITISEMADGRIIEVNESFVRLSGYSPEEARGKTSIELGLWGSDSKARDGWVQLLHSEGRVRDLEMSFLDKWGGIHVCLLAAEVIELEGRPYLLTYATDITKRKRAEEQVRVSREQLRQLAARVQSVREEERTAIAREIHDELGQALTGMKMDLSWLLGRLPANREPLLERGQALTELLDSTIITVRDLSARLRPSVLDDLGLAAALEWQTQELARRTGIGIHLETEMATGDLDRDLATALFRILQEALTNIVRHAEASQVTVSLRREGEDVVLEVGDDGKGIREAQLGSSQSLGILGMRERAFAFGGSVDVKLAEDGGTVVTARVPLEGAAADG